MVLFIHSAGDYVRQCSGNEGIPLCLFYTPVKMLVLDMPSSASKVSEILRPFWKKQGDGSFLKTTLREHRLIVKADTKLLP